MTTLTTYYRTFAPRHWADVPEALRMTLADVRGLPAGRISHSLDDSLQRAGLRHQCAAAIEAFDLGGHVGDETRYLGKDRRCEAPAGHGKSMCWQHRRSEPALPGTSGPAAPGGA